MVECEWMKIEFLKYFNGVMIFLWENMIWVFVGGEVFLDIFFDVVVVWMLGYIDYKIYIMDNNVMSIEYVDDFIFINLVGLFF